MTCDEIYDCMQVRLQVSLWLPDMYNTSEPQFELEWLRARCRHSKPVPLCIMTVRTACLTHALQNASSSFTQYAPLSCVMPLVAAAATLEESLSAVKPGLPMLICLHGGRHQSPSNSHTLGMRGRRLHTNHANATATLVKQDYDFSRTLAQHQNPCNGAWTQHPQPAALVLTFFERIVPPCCRRHALKARPRQRVALLCTAANITFRPCNAIKTRVRTHHTSRMHVGAANALLKQSEHNASCPTSCTDRCVPRNASQHCQHAWYSTWTSALPSAAAVSASLHGEQQW